MGVKVFKAFIISVFCISEYAFINHPDKYSKKAKHCAINDYDVLCVGASYISPLPLRITGLRITKSVFREVRGITFQNLTKNKINTLMIYENRFKHITPDAFKFFGELSFLKISQELLLSVTEIQLSLQSLDITTISVLEFTANSWTTLPDNVFNSLQGSRLKRISLDGNNFPRLNTSVLNPLKNLTKFSCRKCNISNLNVKGGGYLKILYLNDNNLHGSPSVCALDKSSGLSDHLEHLDLSRNAFTSINPQVLGCLRNVKKFILDNNPIKTLVSHAFVEMPQLETLSLNLLHGLEYMQGSVFASKTLKYLRLQRSFHFDHKGTYEPHSVFYKIPNLNVLDISNNFLPYGIRLVRMFSHLKKLKKLIMSKTRLIRIPYGFLQTMPSLEVLNLEGNKISEWKSGTFVGVNHLNKMYLSGNEINIINSTSFPPTILKTLKLLDLSDNPFSCTCDLKWFSDYLKNSNLTSILSNWPNRYSCGSPKSLKYSYISKFHPSVSECSQMRLFYIITITVCSLVIAFFFLIYTIFKCQTNIKNLVYFIR